jgi:energy-coupling factor transport system permease protein
MGRKLERNDYIVITVVVLFMVTALSITYADGNRFYNPFV